jgi:hypothetical protein
VTWVVGVSQASESKLVYALTYFGLAVPGVAAPEQLILLEPATASGAARTAWFHLFVANVGYVLFDDRLNLEVRAAFEPIGKSFALGPRVTWQGVEGWKFWAGAEVFEGSAFSPFGYFSRNDKVLLGVRAELF